MRVLATVLALSCASPALAAGLPGMACDRSHVEVGMRGLRYFLNGAPTGDRDLFEQRLREIARNPATGFVMSRRDTDRTGEAVLPGLIANAGGHLARPLCPGVLP